MMDISCIVHDIVWQVAVAESDTKRITHRLWSAEEEKRVCALVGTMTDAEIGESLGRSAAAIKVRRVRKGMPAHSKRPGWITGNQAGKTLGIDIHSLVKLVDRGILPMERIPGLRGILNIRIEKLYQWAVNPEHWIYFKVENVIDEKLKRLIVKKSAKWNNEWWSIGKVAEWHGVDDANVNNFIHAGKVLATQWGNWWIKRSEALKPGLYFPHGKGSGMSAGWSDEADIFLILARDESKSWCEIGRMMKKDRETVRLHYLKLENSGQIELLREKYFEGRE